MTQIELAVAWLHCNRPDLTLAACDRIRDQNASIAVQHLRALALVRLERQGDLLDALAAYRDKAGCHPELLRTEAAALESAGKRSAAADCWWEVLRLMPGDRDALYEFCRLAEGPRRAEIKQLLAKNKKPVDRAVDLAEGAIIRDEVAAAETLVDYVRAAAPNSAALEQLTGLQLDHDQQHLQAAEHYLQASKLEENADKKRRLFNQYLASMAAGGQAAQGYLAADDPDAAFEFLTEGYDVEESYITDDESLAALLDAHRQRKPDDARLENVSGRLLLSQGKFAEAAAAFAKAEAAGNDQLSEVIRSGRLEALSVKVR